MTTKTRKLASGRYLHLVSGVEIVRVHTLTNGYSGVAWITRDPVKVSS